MREDNLPAIVNTELGFLHLCATPDHFTSISANQMNAQDQASLLVHNDLTQTVCAFIFGNKTT